MKTSFKQFLKESIAISGDSLLITVQHSKAASDKDSISTYFKNQPYITKIKGCESSIYSLLNYLSSETSTTILKSLKGSGPYRVDDRQLSKFLDQVKEAASIVVKRADPDVIIYPKSKSDLVKKFVLEIVKSAPNADLLTDAFIKTALDAENVEPLINTAHPDWEKFASENPKEVKKLKQALKSNLKNGELELKKFYKPYAKFIKNFIELQDAYEVLDKVLGRRVLIVDDILSTGSTMAEMVRQIEELEPEIVVGLTLFKHTTQLKAQ